VTTLFSDLVGQSLAVSLLEAALRHNRIAPAYLLHGPDGVGRRLAALRFLEGVLADGQPDLKQRRRLEARNHPDLLWVEPTYSHQGRLVPRSEAEEAGVNRRSPPQVRLEQIRELGRFLARQPLEARRGLVVLEEPEAMAEAAANGLLKTLEEPGHGLLILLSAAPERLLDTIRSRCQQIRLVRLGPEAMHQVLERQGGAAAAALAALEQPDLAALAAGSPGALLHHAAQWQAVPEALRQRLEQPPQQPVEVLALARQLSEELNGEQQLWLLVWWEQVRWRQHGRDHELHRLQRLRQQLLAYVQPRLAWEVALLDVLMASS
jgi:DNA polymerase-3 subunit delta'